MLPFLLAMISLADWVPARWPTADPKTLDLLRGTPVNCLLVPEQHWAQPFAAEAARRWTVALAVVTPETREPEAAAKRALAHGYAGIVLEGDFAETVARNIRSAVQAAKGAVIELTPRAAMPFGSKSARPIIGTYQGVWPGVRVEEEGKAHAAPSGAPWIDTNTGFLRFAKATSPSSSIWISVRPPEKPSFLPERYIQAIADAAIVGARWVVAFPPPLQQQLFAGDAAALKLWKRMADHLAYYEQHRDWRAFPLAGKLALVQDVDSGAILSGGILDMIAVKHTPVRPVAKQALGEGALQGTQMAVNVDPSGLTDPQKEALRAFARAGGTLLSGPPGWKLPPADRARVTLSKDDIEKIDAIWKEVAGLTGRRNLGARLFNVSSMLSNLQSSPDGKQLVLQLANYSDYPVEAITVHVLGKYTKAKLYAPGEAPVELKPYENEDGTGIDIDRMARVATLVLD